MITILMVMFSWSPPQQMKVQCQELQRDLTMRRCLARKEEVCGLGGSISLVQDQLEQHAATLEGKHSMLERHWEESLDRWGAFYPFSPSTVERVFFAPVIFLRFSENEVFAQ